jgi:hypothetical protein
LNTKPLPAVNTPFCPNYTGCQIINIEGFISDPVKKDLFISVFCEAGKENWSQCKRYQTKNELNLCPDFVMPDSAYTTDEILDKLETE